MGWPRSTAGRQTGVPVVQTYHALGTVKKRYQGAQDTSPARRIGYERELGRAVDRVVAQCRDEVGELVRLGVPRSRMTVVPSGVNLDTSPRTARPPSGNPTGPGCSPSAGWSSARASRR